MQQFKGLVGPIRNLVDGSKTIQFSVDRKYKQEMHEIDDLFNAEVVIWVFTTDEAKKMQAMAQRIEVQELPETDYNKIRHDIHLLLMNAGLDTRKEEIVMAITDNYTRLRDCPETELDEIWNWLIDGETLPITNFTNLRAKLLKLLEGK